MELIVILNPSSGNRKATSFYQDILRPFLEAVEIPFELLETETNGDGERLGRKLRARWDEDTQSQQGGSENVVCAVLGGDGTSHELITGFYHDLFRAQACTSLDTNSSQPPRLEIIPIPMGTANALFNHLHPPGFIPPTPESTLESQLVDKFISTEQDRQNLSSVLSYLDHRRTSSSSTSASQTNRRSSTLVSLPLQKTSIYAAGQEDPIDSFLSHIVTSTALHASLLHVSETLRNDHPGLERFKLAAEKVIDVEFEATLRLFPPPPLTSSASSTASPAVSTPIELFSPASGKFHPVPSASSGVFLQGPWAYCLASTLVTRLEPQFVILPLLERIPPKEGGPGTADLILVRPGRGKAVREAHKEEDRRSQWQGRVRKALGGAYRDGKHVDEVLQDPIESPEGGAEPEGEVQVYRCAGWEWTPTRTSELSHLVCADGAIHQIPDGGRAVCQVVGGLEQLVWVWK
ncbi:Diacylglycerol kinase, catalytic domain [Phaffia rhodozyma]|uniref:Diacylglycerol kinase, catalytic domain n=1 Tax=Phaffia rhodozyma TaxID=264483 RepID=A0A0F7STC9_PHARH|nr:Diacylglycerol kinase, catalytic domain [Phaffia rhodozyma]